MKIAEPELLDTFKTLLQDQRFGSQLQLARALSLRGFENVTQTRVSRLLHKVGAIKIRNHNNDAVYRLPEKQYIPCGQQAIDSVVLDIKHNQVQIIIKTVIGAATLISKMIESMGIKTLSYFISDYDAGSYDRRSFKTMSRIKKSF